MSGFVDGRKNVKLSPIEARILKTLDLPKDGYIVSGIVIEKTPEGIIVGESLSYANVLPILREKWASLPQELKDYILTDRRFANGCVYLLMHAAKPEYEGMRGWIQDRLTDNDFMQKYFAALPKDASAIPHIFQPDIFSSNIIRNITAENVTDYRGLQFCNEGLSFAAVQLLVDHLALIFRKNAQDPKAFPKTSSADSVDRSRHGGLIFHSGSRNGPPGKHEWISQQQIKNSIIPFIANVIAVRFTRALVELLSAAKQPVETKKPLQDQIAYFLGLMQDDIVGKSVQEYIKATVNARFSDTPLSQGKVTEADEYIALAHHLEYLKDKPDLSEFRANPGIDFFVGISNIAKDAGVENPWLDDQTRARAGSSGSFRTAEDDNPPPASPKRRPST